MANMILAAISGTEQIYFVIDPKEPGQDGVVVTETSVQYVPFWSYVTRTRIQPVKTSGFLQDLWDAKGPESSEWSDTYLFRTEPFPEEVIKRIKPFLVDVPRRKEPKVVDNGLLSFNKKSLPGQVQTKAGRRPLKQEPYDPDARDGDNDGIVQEGTPWERPAATRFLNEVGEQIERGLTSTTRPKGKLVDADGNEVDYTPTYERAEAGTIGVGRQIGQIDRQPKPEQPKPAQPAAAEPGKKPAEKPGKPKVGTPLADHGAGSLKEQGLQSVRQTAAPQPPPAPKPPATEAPAAPVRIDPEIVDRANIPYRPGVGADGEPLVYKRDPNDGGPSFEVSVDDKVREILKDIDKFIEDNPDNEEIKRIREELDSEVPDKFERQVKQEVVDRGLNDVIEAYSKPGKSVYVTLPDDKAVEVLRSGRIKTIHETGTSQGQKDPKVRVEVEEARLGVPKNLPAERRPVYGWIRPIKSADGTEEEGALNTEIYGRIHLRLKKGVRSRSTMTLGDTINDKRTGVPLTPEQRTETVWGQYGRAVESGGPAAAMTTPDRIRGQMARAAISKSHGDEARSRVHARFLEEYPALRAAIGDAPDFTSTGWGRGFAHYTEVQVHGGVDIEDVEAIEVPEGLPEETLAELKRLADERGIKVEVQDLKKSKPTNTLSAEEIREKNNRILEEVRQFGGEFGSAHPDMEKRKLAPDGDPIKQFGTLVTTEERTARRREVMRQTLAGLRVYLETGDAERAMEVGNWDEGIWTDTRDNMVFYQGTSLSDYAKMDPAIKELILNSTEDELVDAIEESLLPFVKGYRDGDIGMAVPNSRLFPLLDDGEYKVAAVIEEEIERGDLDSSARSTAAGAAVRVLYEETIGISAEAPAQLRPASAFISHPEIEDVGAVDMYGDVRISIKPEVKERVAIVRGDPLGEKSHAVKLDTEDDDALLNAFLNYQYEGEGRGERVVARMIAALEARQSGDNSKMMQISKYDSEYAEVYIPGSIEMGEVAKIDLRYGTMDHAIPEDERTEILETLDIPQLLKDAGAPNEVIEEVRQHIPKMVEDSKGRPLYYKTGDGIKGLVNIEVLKRVKERAATRGITEVEVNNRFGDTYNLDWLGMTEAEQTANRVKRIIEESLKRMEDASRIDDDW